MKTFNKKKFIPNEPIKNVDLELNRAVKGTKRVENRTVKGITKKD